MSNNRGVALTVSILRDTLPAKTNMCLTLGKSLSFGKTSVTTASLRLTRWGIVHGSLIDSLNKCLFSTCQVPDNGLSVNNTVMEQMYKVPAVTEISV